MTEQAEPVQITVNVQYVKDFSFESPHAPHIFGPSTAAPTINMGVNAQTRNLAPNTYEVLLMLKMEASLENKTAFIAELSYGGVFSIPNMPEDQLKMFLLVEGPRLLFPFARSIIANAVRDGGFPQMLINPIDFLTLYQTSSSQISAPAVGSA